MKPLCKTSLKIEADVIRKQWLGLYGYETAKELSLTIRRQFLAKKGVKSGKLD